jgi:hypothetical protein
MLNFYIDLMVVVQELFEQLFIDPEGRLGINEKLMSFLWTVNGQR